MPFVLATHNGPKPVGQDEGRHESAHAGHRRENRCGSCGDETVAIMVSPSSLIGALQLMRRRKERAVTADSGRQPADWVAGALAEYEAHRAEVLAEAQGQQQTLALGATAVGILVAGAFNVWDDRLLATIAFLGAIPLLCTLILIQWAGRAFGLMRIGVYLEGLETALRSTYASPPPLPVLTWEKTLVSTRPSKWWRPHYGWNDFGAVAVFALFAAGSIALGSYRGYGGGEGGLVIVLTAIQGAVLLSFTSILAWSLATVRESARRDFGQASDGDGGAR